MKQKKKRNRGERTICEGKDCANNFFGKKIGIDGRGFLVTIFHVVSFLMRYETNHTEGDHVVSVEMNGRTFRSSAEMSLGKILKCEDEFAP